MGIDLNIIFMGYTILSILCFIRTILFMPKITFPFTIPDGYDYGYCEIIQNKVFFEPPTHCVGGSIIRP